MTYEAFLDFYKTGLSNGIFNELSLKLSYIYYKNHEMEWKQSKDYVSYLNGQMALETILGIPHEIKQEEPDKDYVIQFYADVKVTVKVKSPQEAVIKATKMLDEYKGKVFDYDHLSGIKSITDKNGNEY